MEEVSHFYQACSTVRARIASTLWHHGSRPGQTRQYKMNLESATLHDCGDEKKKMSHVSSFEMGVYEVTRRTVRGLPD